MREYIFYAIVFFFPFGAIISYLLHREGLNSKYIAFIVSISLAVVISFPIIMQKMGLSFAIVFYLFLLSTLTAVFIKILQNRAYDFAYPGEGIIYVDNPEEADLVLSQAAYNETASILETIALDDTPVSEIIPVNPELDNQELDEKSLYLPIVPPEKDSEDADNETNVIYTQQSSSEDLEVLQDNIDESENQLPKPESSREPSESLLENEPELEVLPVATQNEMIPILLTSDQNEREQPAIKYDEVNIELNEENRKPDDEEEAIECDSDNDISDDTKEVNNDLVYDLNSLPVEPETPEYIPEEVVLQNNGEMEEKQDPTSINAGQLPVEEVPSGQAGEAVILEDAVDIKEHIEHGFSCKYNNNLVEAAQYFKEACELTVDKELKYILTMEMITLFKDTGRYYEAEQVLESYIGNANIQTDIIDEINLQLSYIRILSTELSRLGMPNTPLSKVPRWIRLTVSEKMNEKIS